MRVSKLTVEFMGRIFKVFNLHPFYRVILSRAPANTSRQRTGGNCWYWVRGYLPPLRFAVPLLVPTKSAVSAIVLKVVMGDAIEQAS